MNDVFFKNFECVGQKFRKTQKSHQGRPGNLELAFFAVHLFSHYAKLRHENESPQ